MIYVGVIHFNNVPDVVYRLTSSLAQYTHTSPTVIKKDSLVFSYGKLSSMHDMDEIWESSSSILVGRIFDKVQQNSFGKEDFRHLSHVNKEELLKKIWGKYVYIHGNEGASQFEIVVDSTGQLPFFYCPMPDGNILFSSYPEIIFKVLGHKPEYNWSYLCSYLIYGNSSALQTPFKNIYELPPACSLKVTKNDRKTNPFWYPYHSCNKTVLQQKDAVNVIQATLKPWINPYKNICVSLSGGLDSSSLVYCLKEVLNEGQTLNALNYFHSSIKSSNEVIHARKVCQETGIDLIEIDASSCLPFNPPCQKQPLNPNKPFPGLVSLRGEENLSNHLPVDETLIFLSGHGSDHIFMTLPSKKSLSDYILEKGFRGSKEKLTSIAKLYRDSFFLIAKGNVRGLSAHFFSRRLRKRHPKNIHDEIPCWIKQEVHQKASSDFAHPIYEYLSSQILPGKYEQIDSLYEGLASIHVEMNQMNPVFYPFLYEPVVEFALAFPAYELFKKGYDRYPLRKAVSDHFRTETVWRRDKSQTTGLFQLGIKKNLKYILNLCLEGQFAKQGLIDREEVHNTIMLLSKGDISHMWPFLHLASAEIFLKLWEGRNHESSSP